MLPRINPTQTRAYTALKSHVQNDLKSLHMKTLFEQDEHRFSLYSVTQNGLLFDYSKNLLTATTKKHLLDLAKECGVAEAMQSLRKGDAINETENRSVMHIALRHFGKVNIDRHFTDPVNKVREKMQHFCDDVHTGKRLGYSKKMFRFVVNIGIGGSDLGPAMIAEALHAFHDKGIDAFFVSNIDGSHLNEVLKKIDPEETLFLIASKTFTTQETMTNAHKAKQYMLEHYNGDLASIAKHFVAISTNDKAVRDFGIAADAQFEFWDWVGGRFSLWSSIGLSIALVMGYGQFEELLRGAENIDAHFFESDWENNIPIWMALISFLYLHFFDAKSEAVLPYAQCLQHFPMYLQQSVMESNGKNIDRTGKPVYYPTCPVVWGSAGTNGQHAYFQLLHQGSLFIPMDFIGFTHLPQPYRDQHDILMSNMFAQAKGFMKGKTMHEVREEMIAQGIPEEKIAAIAPHRVFEGNKPSNTFLFKQLDAFSLGQLIALYEHKIFVNGILANVFSFDQWGVELGKQLANQILSQIKNKKVSHAEDSSTKGLLDYYLA